MSSTDAAFPTGADVLLIADKDATLARAAIEAAGAAVVGPIAPADAPARLAGTRGMVVAVELSGEYAATGALLDALAAAAPTGAVMFGSPLIDRVYGALGGGPLELLCASTPLDRVAAIGTALATARTRGAVYAEDDVARGLRIHQLGQEMERLARLLVDLSQAGDNGAIRGRPEAGVAEGPAIAAPAIRALIRARRLRAHYFDARLFADPAWDMLLDLMAARLERVDVAVSSLCIAAAVPPTTALRWIKTLTDAALLVRIDDPADRRRVFIGLSDEAAAAMSACLAAVVRTGSLAV